MNAAGCSELSLALSESIVGTAPQATSWLALEQPGAWGHDPVRQSDLPATLATELLSRAARYDVKVVLVKRPGRAEAGRGARTCFLVHAAGSRRVAEKAELADVADVLDADLERLGRGEATGLGAPLELRQFLVCTNGRRDRCCSKLGRPVARELSAAYPGRVWECSHLGGHRFAANVLVLPDSFVLGRLDPAAAVEAAATLERGEIPLDVLRGRCAFAAAGQAAEVFLRRELGAVRADDVSLVGETATTFWFAVGKHVYRVGVAAEDGEPRPTSCEGGKLERPIHWRLESIGDGVDPMY